MQCHSQFTAFVVMEEQTDAATQNISRVGEKTRRRKRETYAAGRLSKGNCRPETVSLHFPSRVPTSATLSSSGRITKPRGRSLKPNTPGAARPNTEQFQQSPRMPLTSTTQSEQVYGQYLTPYSLNPSLIAPVQDARSLAPPAAYQNNPGSLLADTSPENHPCQSANFLHSVSVSPGPQLASELNLDTNDGVTGDFAFSNVSLDSGSQAILHDAFELATNIPRIPCSLIESVKVSP